MLLSKRSRPSSGTGSQTAALVTWARQLGRTPGSPSKAGSRTLICLGSSGSRLNRCAPQLRQKHFSNPPSGCRQHWTRSSPWSSRKVRPSIRACADEPDPARRWQRVQWQ